MFNISTFDAVVIKGLFVRNGTAYVKRSSRTAAIYGMPSRWFYFGRKERVEVADKWLNADRSNRP